jgi:hypothetical protein
VRIRFSIFACFCSTRSEKKIGKNTIVDTEVQGAKPQVGGIPLDLGIDTDCRHTT